MGVLVPRNLLTRQEELARARTVEVVALADCPLHQHRAPIDQVVGVVEGVGPSGGARIYGPPIAVAEQRRARGLEDVPPPHPSRPDLGHTYPTRIADGEIPPTAAPPMPAPPRP